MLSTAITYYKMFTQVLMPYVYTVYMACVLAHKPVIINKGQLGPQGGTGQCLETFRSSPLGECHRSLEAQAREAAKHFIKDRKHTHPEVLSEPKMSTVKTLRNPGIKCILKHIL